MKTNKLNKLIREILLEIFVQFIDINALKESSNIIIIFQDNKIQLQKNKDKFKVIDIEQDQRIKVGDYIHFIENPITIGDEIQCSIYRINEYKKLIKTNFTHKFSEIQSIEVS